MIKRLTPLVIFIQAAMGTFAQTSTFYGFKYYVPPREASRIVDRKDSVIETISRGAWIERERTVTLQGRTSTLKYKVQAETDMQVYVVRKSRVIAPSAASGYCSIKQIKDTLHINPWLNNTFDEDTTYVIKLENRGVPKVFKFSTVEVTALTIPFKYLFKKKDSDKNITAPADFQANINVGVFVGYTWGRHTFYYFKNEDEKSPRSNIVQSVGGFLTLGTVKLDSASTSLDDKPLSYEVNVGLVSPGIGYHISVGSVKTGIYLGYDIAIGASGRKWNHANMPWIGIGFGFNLGVLSNFANRS